MQAERRRNHLGELGLADSRRAFDEDRLLEMGGEIDHRRNAPIADVALLGEAADHVLNARKHACSSGSGLGDVWGGASAGLSPKSPVKSKEGDQRSGRRGWEGNREEEA